ncbi:hypothetical protein [Prochlorothrix hollandica]|uniref:hypothetical protein n=1 Tax=Prochlorothrix hollandica TaxID=1223 RepID=UPI0009DA69E5
MGEGLFHLGRFPDFGRGNPPVVAPVGGRQEGRHGGENPTRGRNYSGGHGRMRVSGFRKQT